MSAAKQVSSLPSATVTSVTPDTSQLTSQPNYQIVSCPQDQSVGNDNFQSNENPPFQISYFLGSPPDPPQKLHSGTIYGFVSYTVTINMIAG